MHTFELLIAERCFAVGTGCCIPTRQATTMKSRNAKPQPKLETSNPSLANGKPEYRPNSNPSNPGHAKINTKTKSNQACSARQVRTNMTFVAHGHPTLPAQMEPCQCKLLLSRLQLGLVFRVHHVDDAAGLWKEPPKGTGRVRRAPSGF